MITQKIFTDMNRYQRSSSATLYEKVRRYKITEGGEYNYIGMNPLPGKFFIQNNEIKSIMLHSLKAKHYLPLVEKYNEACGQILMWDLDIPLNESDTEINIDMFLPLIALINKVLTNVLENVYEECQTCYILTRKPLQFNAEYKGGIKHYGIHIYYPDIILNLTSAKIIYDNVVKACQQQEIFKVWEFLKEEFKYVSRYAEIIDKITAGKTGIVIHGGAKPEKVPYAIQYKVYHDLTYFMYDGKIEKEYEYFLEKFAYNQPKEKIMTLKVISNQMTQIKQSVVQTNTNTEVDFQHVTELMSLISPERANNRDDWFKIGLCLHQISVSEEMKDIFIDFSRQCPEKFNLEEVTKTWNNLPYKESGGMTIGTLKHWAKLDSPEQYEKLIDSYLDNTLNETIFDLKNTNFDIASLMYKIFKGQFICANIDQNIWYRYENHKWNKEPAAHNLYLNISTRLEKYYYKKINTLRDNDNLSEETEKHIRRIIHDIKTTSFKKNVIQESKHLFYKEDFLELLDEKNTHLMHFNNGIYDLNTFTLRKGTPDDYVSYTTNVDFIEYEKSNNLFEEVYQIFRNMHEEVEITNFFLDSLALSLHGVNHQNFLHMWIGKGSNGKSLTCDFLSKALGDYSYAPSITMLTEKRKSSSCASPDVVKVKGRRCLIYQEPEGNDTISVGFMKSLFGNDTIVARGLYQDEIRFKPQATGFLSCNVLPNIAPDEGTFRRIRVLRFPYKFTFDEPKNKFEKPADPNLINRLDELKHVFASYLVYRYQILKKNHNGILHTPQSVIDETNKYKAKSDIYQAFVNEAFPKNIDTINSQELFEVFQEWMKNENIKNDIKKREFVENIETKIGTIEKNGYWININI